MFYKGRIYDIATMCEWSGIAWLCLGKFISSAIEVGVELEEVLCVRETNQGHLSCL